MPNERADELVNLDDELDGSRLVKLFLPLLLGHMSTGRSEVNKHIKQLRTYKNTFYIL